MAYLIEWPNVASQCPGSSKLNTVIVLSVDCSHSECVKNLSLSSLIFSSNLHSGTDLSFYVFEKVTLLAYWGQSWPQYLAWVRTHMRFQLTDCEIMNS